MEDSLKEKKKREDEIFLAMGDIYDPEIMAPITDLGLIYRVEVRDGNIVEVDLYPHLSRLPLGACSG